MASLLQLLNFATSVVYYLLVAGILLSMAQRLVRARWIHHPAVLAIVRGCDAILAPFRRLLARCRVPLYPLDISPILAIMALQLLHRLLVGLLLSSPIP